MKPSDTRGNKQEELLDQNQQGVIPLVRTE